jgi:uncharacterized membrane protein YbhN (UPF0104 family)
MAARLWSVARWALPWAIAGLLLFVLMRRVSPGILLATVRQARVDLFAVATLIAVTLWFLLESAALAYLFSRFNAPLSWREARSLRALTYLLTPINWNLGTGAMILHLRRAKGVAALEATSSVFFYGLIDGVVLASLSLAGVLALPSTAGLRSAAWTAGCLLATQLVLLALFMLPLPRWRWLGRLRSVRLFRTHGLASSWDTALLLTIRTLYFAGFVLFFWAGMRAFHVPAPLNQLAAGVPLVLLAGSLPITPGGLGTQQTLMLALFADYGSEAQILAYGLAFPIALIVGRMPLALLYLRDLGELRPPAGRRPDDAQALG